MLFVLSTGLESKQDIAAMEFFPPEAASVSHCHCVLQRNSLKTENSHCFLQLNSLKTENAICYTQLIDL